MWRPTVSSDELYHYAKGSRAKKHKYIAIKNGRYIYPDDAKKGGAPIMETTDPFMTAEQAEENRKYYLNALKNNRKETKAEYERYEKLYKKAEKAGDDWWEFHNKPYGSPVIAEQEVHQKQDDVLWGIYSNYADDANNSKHRADRLKNEHTAHLNKLLLKSMRDIKNAKMNEIRNEQIKIGASKIVSNPIIAQKVRKLTPKKTNYTKEEFGGDSSYNDWINSYENELNNSKKKKVKKKSKPKTTSNGTVLRKKKIESGGSGVKKRKRSK